MNSYVTKTVYLGSPEEAKKLLDQVYAITKNPKLWNQFVLAAIRSKIQESQITVDKK